MITYPVDTEETKGKWMLLDTNTDQMVRLGQTGNWPNGDGSEIVGLDANLIPLLKVRDEQPSPSGPLNRVVGTPTVNVGDNEIRTTWAIIDRDLAEKLEVLDNLEFTEANKHVNINRELLETRIVVAALLRTVKNLNVPGDLQAMADEYLVKATKIFKNRQQIEIVRTKVTANEKVDVDKIPFESE